MNRFVACVLFGSVLSLSCSAAEFRGLGDLPGGGFSSRSAAISSDSTTVVGQSESGAGYQAFRWTEATGLRPLTDVPNDFRQSDARDVSAHGEVVVGQLFASGAGGQAFRWTARNGFEQLGDLPGEPDASVAAGISAEGTVVVGTGNFSAGGGPKPVTGEAFRWTAGSRMVGLGDLPGEPRCSRALAVSADGKVIVGKGDCDASFQVEDLGQAYRWTESEGLRPLGFLPGGSELSVAEAISADGRVVVGASQTDAQLGGSLQAFRWTEPAGMLPLFGPNDWPSWSSAADVSADGAVIVGQRWREGAQQSDAYIWDARHGARDVADLLRQQGLKEWLDGWNLNEATGVSGDGFTLTGNGTNPQGQTEAWLATLEPDTPGDLNHDDQLSPVDIDLLSAANRQGASSRVYDLNRDGKLDQQDRAYWVHDLAQTHFGDANLDKHFGTEDLVHVLQAGQYEDHVAGNSAWSSGDWDGNADFETGDLVLALQDGAYEQDPLQPFPAATVPEPAMGPSVVILGYFVGLIWCRRRACTT
jgi:probable HAF family extracellular repeat protein